MKNKRRDFLKLTGMTTLGVVGGGFSTVFGSPLNSEKPDNFSFMEQPKVADESTSIIGAYGAWAAGLRGNKK